MGMSDLRVMNAEELVGKLVATILNKESSIFTEHYKEIVSHLAEGEKYKEILQSIYDCRYEGDKIICIIEHWKTEEKAKNYQAKKDK